MLSLLDIVTFIIESYQIILTKWVLLVNVKIFELIKDAFYTPFSGSLSQSNVQKEIRNTHKG